MAKKKKTKLEAIDGIYEALCEYFKSRLESDGEVSPQEIKNIVQFLKDNGITATISESNENAPLNRLLGAVEASGGTTGPGGLDSFPFAVNPSLLPPDDPVVEQKKAEVL